MVSPEQLQVFLPFQSLDDYQLILLASKAQSLSVEKGATLFSFGDIDSNEYFLLKGTVELLSDDGIKQVVADQDFKAKHQLSRLRPRQYSCRASQSCQLIVVDADIIDELLVQSRSLDSDDESYGVDEVDSIEEFERREILSRFNRDLKSNKFILPSLPEVAIKVRRLIEDEQASIATIASVINTDPSIAAKLIRAANSPIYRGVKHCDTTPNAITRLGLDTTRKLVISFSLKDIFKGSNLLKEHMRGAWQHSVEVAAICMVIGRRVKLSNISSDELMLAGLLHDIGVIAALSFIQEHKELGSSQEKIDATINLLRGPAGEAILRQWNFHEGFIDAAKYAKDWSRTHLMQADICDVVQVAKLHSYIRQKKKIKQLPRIDTLPAFSKLPLGEVTPELTIKILDESREQIREAQQLLS